MQRLRIRYAKRGRLRFTSHRDFSRAFERAVFRARVPMAYSSGFNPHPRISYAGAAPTGSASEAEYLEIALAEVVDPAAVHALLARPCRRARPGRGRRRRDRPAPGRPARGQPLDHRRAADAAGARAGVEAFLARSRSGRADDQEGPARVRLPRRRGRLEVLDTPGRDGGARLDLVLRHAVPSVRPDDVLTGLARADRPDDRPGTAADPAGAGPARPRDRRDRRPAAPG